MKYIFLLILAFPVMASDDHHKKKESIINNYSVVNQYSKGVSSAMALSGQSYDWAVDTAQWSISGSSFSGKEGFAGGVGKRFGSVLININIATEESGSPAYVFGASGRF